MTTRKRLNYCSIMVLTRQHFNGCHLVAPETPEVIRRLFGGTVAVPTRRSRALPKRSAFLPDPIFWKVLEYYRLGDWRRPSTLPP